MSGPVPGATTTFTYDDYGRKRTSTDAAGLTLTYDYDALDRVTKVTYPDTTYEETVYNRLDAEKRRDRLGRWTQTFYDALRRPVATQGCGRRDDAVPVRGRRVHLLRGRRRQAHEAHRPQRQRDHLGLRPPGPGDAGDAGGREQRELHLRDDHEPPQAEDGPQERHDDLRVLPGRQAEAQELLRHDARGELHLRPRRRADAHGRQRHGHAHLDLRQHGPRRDRGQHEERLDRRLHATTTPGTGRCSRSTARPTSPTATTSRAGSRASRGGRTRSASATTPPSRRTSMTYPNGVVTTYGYDTESRLTSLGASLSGTPITSFSYVLGRGRQPHAQDDPRLGRGLWLRRGVPPQVGRPLRGHAVSVALRLRPRRQPNGGPDGRRGHGRELQQRERAADAAAGRRAGLQGHHERARFGHGGRARPHRPPPTTASALRRRSAQARRTWPWPRRIPSGNVRTNTYRVTTSGAGTTYTYDPNGNLTSKGRGNGQLGLHLERREPADEGREERSRGRAVRLRPARTESREGRRRSDDELHVRLHPTSCAR